MAEGRRRDQWLHTAMITAAVMNTTPRDRPVQLRAIYPYYIPPTDVVGLCDDDGGNIDALRAWVPGGE